MKYELRLESTDNKYGWAIKTLDDVVSYLTNCAFADDYVPYGAIEDAVFRCAKELGCIYRDLDELENDIRRYYI